MRHARDDYNDIKKLDRKIPKDEPVFLLRAQDPAAADAVLAWCDKAKRLGADPRMIEIAKQHAADMRRWRPKKDAPDMPPNAD